MTSHDRRGAGWRRLHARLRRLEPASSEWTPKSTLLCRRRVNRGLASAALLSAVLPLASKADGPEGGNSARFDDSLRSELTDKARATSYNNYAEFSSEKSAVKFLARELTTEPWPIHIGGEVNNPLTLDVEELPDIFEAEERVYRFRCVEGWSMVVPWEGIPLCDLLARVEPTSRAKYVQFESLVRPSEMIGQRRGTLEWPYREALRLDEAMNPLTMLVTGMYGEKLPAQNGGPVRLIVPWKYGFKSSKAITRISLVEHAPVTSWQQRAPSEYGFYGNVNPDVPHPRWSQSRENRLGELRKRPTLMLNGYADEVGQLYSGLDPATLF